MNETKEQKRAANAWDKVQGCNRAYANLTKGLPALIMNSGLLQVLAFLYEKGRGNSEESRPHAKLENDLREWLRDQFHNLDGSEFKTFMPLLMKKESAEYQRITAEALAWLRWMRHFAAAVAAD